MASINICGIRPVRRCNRYYLGIEIPVLHIVQRKVDQKLTWKKGLRSDRRAPFQTVPSHPTSSPSDSKLQLQLDVDQMARTRDLPSSTSWDSCYIQEASVEDLRFWMPTPAATVLDGMPVFRVSREEDQAIHSQTRKLILRQTREEYVHLQFERRLERDLRETQQQRVAAIERELKRLDRKRLRLNKVLEYEVLNRLVTAIDKEAREDFLSNEEIVILKAACFNWFGYFVDLHSKFHRVIPDVHAIATKVLEHAGEALVNQFRLCRTLMSCEQGRHGQQPHPRPVDSVEHAKTIISTMAITSPDLDVGWIHAIIDRSGAFSAEGAWVSDDHEDLEEQIQNLEAEKAGLERLLEPTDEP
ncbi:hypothetical protein GGX14DRAFT_390530 [Mycena pura]|uniref:Uncharacterized protein n=1 Tax=Mycena pura TaxID=153505 RepID=A0AAD6YJZ1_9AGAR|nr:hypothetical protein GGX14DRAFT_390530 [Mycena pura]